jgi:hypothetical protein
MPPPTILTTCLLGISQLRTQLLYQQLLELGVLALGTLMEQGALVGVEI